MDGMSPSDLLSSLTADRLEALAAREEETAASLCDEIGGVEWEYDYHRQIAAVLRALAGAERITDLELNNAGAIWYAVSPRDGFVRHEAPTLISALASVAKQEEPHDVQ